VGSYKELLSIKVRGKENGATIATASRKKKRPSGGRAWKEEVDI